MIEKSQVLSEVHWAWHTAAHEKNLFFSSNEKIKNFFCLTKTIQVEQAF